jgi:hypothetical protein
MVIDASIGHVATKDMPKLVAAILACQLGGLPAETLALMRGTAWAFAVCFAAITVVSWRYLFVLPIVFSMVITGCI